MIQALGIEFRPMRAFQADQINSDVAKFLLDSTRWWALLINDQVMPQLRYGYQDICEAADGADLLVAHPLSCGTPLAAEKLGLPWVSTCLAPVSFWSAYDPCPLCYPGPLGFFANHRVVGPAIHKLILRYLDSKFQSEFQPWRQLRREIGLPDTAAPLRHVQVADPPPGMVFRVAWGEAKRLAREHGNHRLPVLRQLHRRRPTRRACLVPGQRPASPCLHAQQPGSHVPRAILRGQRRGSQAAWAAGRPCDRK